MGIDLLTIDTVCVDEIGCASLASTFAKITAFKPRTMTTGILEPGRGPTPVTGG